MKKTKIDIDKLIYLDQRVVVNEFQQETSLFIFIIWVKDKKYPHYI